MWYTKTNTKCFKKWVKDKQNERVLGQTNNQAHVVQPTQEWQCAWTTSERAFARNEVNSINSYSCNWSIKEEYI